MISSLLNSLCQVQHIKNAQFSILGKLRGLLVQESRRKELHASKHQSNQRQSHPIKFIQWCWLCRTSLEDRAQYTVWQSQSYPLTCIYKPLQENAIRRFIHWKKLGEIDEYEKGSSVDSSWLPLLNKLADFDISNYFWLSICTRTPGSTWSCEFSTVFLLAIHIFWFLFVLFAWFLFKFVHCKEVLSFCHFQIYLDGFFWYSAEEGWKTNRYTIY